MSCVYGTSGVFSVVSSDAANSMRRPGIAPVKLIPIYGGRCRTARAGLMAQLSQDVLYRHAIKRLDEEMPKFIILAHKDEWSDADMVISPYIEKYVEIRDITLGYPLAYGYYLYVTDPAAVGLPHGEITETDVLNTMMRNALRIAYIVKPLTTLLEIQE